MGLHGGPLLTRLQLVLLTTFLVLAAACQGALVAAAMPIDYVHEWPSPAPVTEVVPWTADDVREALAEASPRARCVVQREIGGVGLDPYRNGAAGELGPVQLHPAGKLADFYARGGTDPHSPWQSIAFLEDALLRGEGRAWSPVYWGLC